MHDRIDVSGIIMAVLFTSLGIIFPMLFHLVGAGSIFLPMYIPLAVGACLMKRSHALMIGAFTPILSSILTGMPPMYPPIAFMMSIQLGCLCLVISTCIHSLKAPVFLSLLAALMLERLTMALLYLFIMPLFGVNAEAFTIYDLARGLPGVGLILILVPVIVPRAIRIINRNRLRLYEKKGEPSEP